MKVERRRERGVEDTCGQIGVKRGVPLHSIIQLPPQSPTAALPFISFVPKPKLAGFPISTHIQNLAPVVQKTIPFLSLSRYNVTLYE